MCVRIFAQIIFCTLDFVMIRKFDSLNCYIVTMKFFASIFSIVAFSAAILFADEPATVQENAPAAVAQEAAPAVESVSLENPQSCSAEKDSLKKALEVEQAKSENWEKSYNTIKQNNEVCAHALSVSIGVNEKKKEKEAEERQQTAMMASTSFLGGVGFGMLLFWLIFE